MAVFRRTVMVLMIAAVGLGLAACSRKITRVELVAAPATACFQCHSDTSTFLLAASQEWSNSRHAASETLFESDGTCKNCHTSEGFVARVTGGTAPDAIENPTAIGCFTCHAPHTNGDFRLRWTAPTTLANGVTADLGSGNICAACHQGRRNVTTYVATRTTLSTRFGPHHSNQSDVLIGSNAYEYAGYVYDRTTHAEATEDGCLDCHMKNAVGNVVGGHSFNMKWEGGIEELTNTEACAPCHGEIDDFDYHGVQTEVDGLVADLEARLVAAGLFADGAPAAVTTSRDSAGAVFNLMYVKEDRSRGVHNPAYVRGLLESSIQFISGTPGLSASHVQRAMAGRR